MIPELGQFSLILAFATAILLGSYPLLGASWGAPWHDVGGPSARLCSVPAIVAVVPLPDLGIYR